MCGIGAVFFSEGTNFKYNVPKMAVRLMKGQKGRGSKGAGIGTFTHGKKGYISYHKGADPIEFVFCKKRKSL